MLPKSTSPWLIRSRLTGSCGSTRGGGARCERKKAKSRNSWSETSGSGTESVSEAPANMECTGSTVSPNSLINASAAKSIRVGTPRRSRLRLLVFVVAFRSAKKRQHFSCVQQNALSRSDRRPSPRKHCVCGANRIALTADRHLLLSIRFHQGKRVYVLAAQ